MRTYIIVYQLRDSWADYSKFYETLKEHYEDNVHFMETAWLVRTENSAEDILKVLRDKVRVRDSIFVAEITENMDGFVTGGLWRWLKTLEKSE